MASSFCRASQEAISAAGIRSKKLKAGAQKSALAIAAFRAQRAQGEGARWLRSHSRLPENEGSGGPPGHTAANTAGKVCSGGIRREVRAGEGKAPLGQGLAEPGPRLAGGGSDLVQPSLLPHPGQPG